MTRSSAAAGIVGALALLALAACQREAAAEAPLRAPPGGPSVAERMKVLNADVFLIDGRHIRLADAAAPQPVPDARCWAEALAAKQATAAVRELVRDAGALRVVPTGRRDEYNREIARVALDNQDLSNTLHDLGMAAEAGPGRFSWCAPISAGGEGAPDVKSLLDFSPG